VVRIVKLGGSVITTKGEGPRIRDGVLDRLAGELADAPGEVVLVHGAGSYGHPLARAHDLDEGVETDELAPLSQVHRQVRELNLAVLDTVADQAGPCLTVSPYGQLGCNDGQPGGWNLVPVHRTLELDAIPVLHGDIVLDTAREVTVLSGDTIAIELARFLDADQVVFALDQPGAYSHPPEDADAELLREPDFAELREARDRAKSEATDATGGMATKLDATMAIARAGTEVALVDGTEPGRLRDALHGDLDGTHVLPEVAP
jgi:isopentenyl phosphate kinase